MASVRFERRRLFADLRRNDHDVLDPERRRRLHVPPPGHRDEQLRIRRGDLSRDRRRVRIEESEATLACLRTWPIGGETTAAVERQSVEGEHQGDNRRVDAGEDRADALFALPTVPRRVRLIGGELWAAGVERRGFEVVDENPDVVVVVDRLPNGVLAMRPPAVVVDGPPSAAQILRRSGYEAARLFSLPVEGTPVLFADLERRNAARYAAVRGIVHAERWRTLRNTVVGCALGYGVPMPFRRLVTIAAAAPRPPALIAAARALGARPTAWIMQVSAGGVVRRNAFLLFDGEDRVPSLALKFGRVREMTTPFDREAAGYDVVASAGPAVAIHTPSYIGRFEVDGFHASLETAAVGERLSTYLRRPVRRASKLRILDRVATWLVDVAQATALPAGSLAGERAWLEAEAIPHWGERLPVELANDLDSTPGTFQHHDLAEENVVVRRAGFTVVDWEWAQRAGLPFGDLVYFAAHTLRIVDGVSEQEREDYFVELFRGRAPASKTLSRWVQSLAAALDVRPESVGPLVTLTWVRRSEFSRRERARAEKTEGRRFEPAVAEKFAERWVSTPDLGPRWAAWRR